MSTQDEASAPEREWGARGEIRVALGVHPPLWSEILRLVLDLQPGITILGAAVSEEGLAQLVDDAGPCVLLLDYEGLGPGAEGIVARLRRRAPRCRVLVLARRSQEDTVVSVLRAGAAGLVGKERPFATVLAALRAVAAGEVWADRVVTAQVLSQLVTPSRPDPDSAKLLTRREWEVVDGVSRGLRNREIAAELGISEKTVKSHLTNVLAKTRVSGRVALALWAQGQSISD